ncbi:choice-of-anchor P family protein [Nitriliruptor alkaliphilus]|uniref:choice-of-anchor P family protein n=1 Tax=Nitriliruptor alkaliphilus TaxID=427918 RepID=UPI00069898B9|nr:choice-of-anchor P family protein [Nitriliruptor alkaliphilus]
MSLLRTLRRSGAAAGVLGLVLIAAAPDAGNVRTDPGDIAGFGIDATAAPITVRIFEQTIPIPADPGVPQAEITTGHSWTTLGGGPTSRAVASLVWPGPGVGDGYGNFAEAFGMDPESTYPLRAAAQFPSGPLTEDNELPHGGGMWAHALGLDVEAEAEFAGELLPGLLGAGTARSVSRSTVEDGLGTAVADSILSEVSLLEGLISVDGVRTRLVATTDGVEATVRGATDVTGLVVAGTRYAIDRDGVRVEAEDEDSPFAGTPSLPLRLLGVVDLQDLIGIRVEAGLVEDLEASEDIAEAGRRAEGVTITLDASPLFDLANALPTDELLALLPDDLRGPVLQLLGLSPTVEIALGFAEVEASATEAFVFEIPDLPPPPPLDDLGAAPPPDLGAPGDLGDLPGAPDLGAPDLGDVGAPSVSAQPDPGPEAPAVALPTTSAGSVPDGIGLAAQLLLLTGGLVGLAAWGLERLRGAAFAVPAGAAACRGGAARGVPDLRT